MNKPHTVIELDSAGREPVRQARPDFSATAFARRLRAGLDALQIAESERPAVVAEAGHVTIRTARRWLAGKQRPRSAVEQFGLADRLGLSGSWLAFERGPILEAEAEAEREQARRFLEAYRSNPAGRQRLIRRTLARMANESPRVARLAELHDRGQIAADLFLALAGK